MRTRIYEEATLGDLVPDIPPAYQANYYAMYSSVFDGIVTDPSLMLLPVDDHVVHRGDGVFETIKCVHGSIYNMGAHLGRLFHSANRLRMNLPVNEETLVGLIVDTVCAGGHRDCSIRVLLTRGPGGLSANPYECPSPQLYIIASKLSAPFMEQHPQGARVGISAVSVKPSFFATIKSCNYLPNVLMTREAVDAGLDFMVAFDDRRCLTEGATENIAIVSKDCRLLLPKMDNILAGTTMQRVLELIEANPLQPGIPTAVIHQDITLDDMLKAPEILIFGTTRDVTAVAEFDGQSVGSGQPGQVYTVLAGLLQDDIINNAEMHTKVF